LEFVQIVLFAQIHHLILEWVVELVASCALRVAR